MTEGNLKKLISKAPLGPGIYIFTDPLGKKLYIGKAANLKTRLSSYLKTEDQRILQMLARASGIKTLGTGSEIEALILESQYIKKYKPAFNIMLRDDKQFFYVKVTKELWPKIFVTHQPNSKYRNIEISSFVGPFTDGAALKTTLRYLRRIFPYCTCKKPHNNFCLNYHIGKCYGFCCLKNPELKITSQPFVNTPRSWCIDEYRKNITATKNILSGKRISFVKKLEKEMIKLGKEEKFKEAIEFRGKLEKIKRVFENARIIRNSSHYDTSKYHSETVSADLKRVLGLKKIPVRIEGYDISNIQGKYAVGAMVVFSRSTSSGQANYKPDKNEYRKFKIYTKHSPGLPSVKAGDTYMLKEILKRRFNHPEWQSPDLLLIDGGKAQLNAVHSVVKKTRALNKLSARPSTNDISALVPIVALTKDKKHRGSKIYTSGRKSPTPLSQLPTPFKNLLLQIDSEAHRFAISYYRRLHRRTIK